MVRNADAHARREFIEITRTGPAPTAKEGVALIRDLYAIEAYIRGSDPSARLAARQQRCAPILARPIALNRKNALFAGHDVGAENWAVIASLIATCKMNSVEPQAWLTATLTAIVRGHMQSQIDDLLPWNDAPKV